MQSAKDGKNHQITLKKFKNNPEILDTLLRKEKKVTNNAEGLGIILGKTDAKYKIIKVCNPYCQPCSMAHPILSELLRVNPEIQLQIIFAASTESSDPKRLPVEHLLAVASQDVTKINEALDDWYLTPQKNYTEFARKYPLNDSIKRDQADKIRAMSDWCRANDIQFTPTIFINGSQLPDIFSLSDLKYLLTN